MDKIRVAAMGDIMLGDHPVCFGHGVRSTIRKKGFDTLLSQVHAQLKQHDALVANLECVLSDIGNDDSKLSSSELRGDRAFAPKLNICEHNVLSMANNHMLQHGIAAFNDTATALRENNIQPVGLYESGYSNVIRITEGSVKIAIVGYSFRPEYFFKENRFYAHSTPADVISQLLSLQNEDPHTLIVVSLHWGEEYLHAPSASQIDFAHQMVDSGATLIIGHHPHVLQGIETYKTGLIAYSLGNFLFDSWQKPTRESAILSCTFTANGISEFKLIPFFIETNYSLSLAEGDKRKILEKLDNYTALIAQKTGLTKLNDDEYQRIAAKAYFRYRLECYFYFITHIWKYEFRIVFSSLFRALLRRVGLA